MDEFVAHLRQRADDNRRKSEIHSVASDELHALYQGIAIGRKRSANELEDEIES